MDDITTIEQQKQAEKARETFNKIQEQINKNTSQRLMNRDLAEKFRQKDDLI